MTDPSSTQQSLPQATTPSDQQTDCVGGNTISQNLEEDYYYYSGGVVSEQEKEALRHVWVATNVTHIDDEAFADCESLLDIALTTDGATQHNKDKHDGQASTSESIPRTTTKETINTVQVTPLERIGRAAFYGCSSLTSLKGLFTLKAEKSPPSSPSASTTMTIGMAAFGACHGLTEIEFPSQVQISMEPRAFAVCAGLQTLKLSNSKIEKINSRVFEDCTQLQTIEWPGQLQEIGELAFSGCSALTTLVGLPSTLEVIGKSAFRGCSGLTMIELPASLQEMGEGAFSGCSGITRIEWPAMSKIQVIQCQTFSYCLGLQQLQLPTSVHTIEESAFEFCSGISRAIFPNSVRNIGKEAFQHCSGLEYIEWSDNIRLLGYRTFNNCKKLDLDSESIRFKCDINRGGRQFLFYRPTQAQQLAEGNKKEKSTENDNCGTSSGICYLDGLWSLIFYRAFQTMELPKERFCEDYDEYNIREDVRRASVAYYLLFNGIQQGQFTSLMK